MLSPSFMIPLEFFENENPKCKSDLNELHSG
jgi:hypothetical protein